MSRLHQPLVSRFTGLLVVSVLAPLGVACESPRLPRTGWRWSSARS